MCLPFEEVELGWTWRSIFHHHQGWMTRSSWSKCVLTAIVTTVAFGVTVTAYQRWREPVYQGRRASEWIEGWRDPGAKVAWQTLDPRREAIEAITAIGPAAIPYLAQTVARGDSVVTKACWALRTKFPRLQRYIALRDSRMRIRDWAIDRLREILTRHPEASFDVAAEALARAAVDREANDPNLYEIGIVRSYAIPLLAKLAVVQHNPVAIAQAIALLNSHGPAAGELATSLGVTAVLSKGSVPAEFLPALRPKLASPDRNVRIFAARTVWYTHHDTNEALDVLIGFLERSPEVSTTSSNLFLAGLAETAANLLGEIGPPAARAIPALREALRDTAPSVRYQVATALRRIDPEFDVTGELLPILMVHLKHSEEAIRLDAVERLGGMGDRARVSAPALRDALRTRSVNDLWRVGNALMNLEPALAPEVAAAMAQELSAPTHALTPTDRLEIAKLLNRTGVGAQVAEAGLLGLLADADVEVRLNSAEALTNISVTDQAARRRLMECLIDCLDGRFGLELRRRAAQALGQFGAEAKAAAPWVVAGLKSSLGASPGAAATFRATLRKIDPEGDVKVRIDTAASATSLR